MITRTLSHDPSTGWSGAFPDLDSARTLVLVFGNSDVLDNPAPLHELRQAFPTARILGCSTSGHVLGDAILDSGLVATFVQFDSCDLRLATADAQTGNDSYHAGRSLASQLAGPGLRWVFVLSDGTTVNGSALARGLREGLDDGVLVTGGLAGDGPRFQRTWVCCDGAPRGGIVAAVGVYGDALEARHGCRGGWLPFGPERRVTRSSANQLFEIDGKPALALYEEYLGERAAELPASALLFPLGLRRPGQSHMLVRTVLGISRTDQSMTFAGDLPEGSVVQLMRASHDGLLNGAAGAAAMALPTEPRDGPSLCLWVSCVGRRLVLRHRADEELDEVRAAMPKDSAHVGFYSYGELSPLVSSACELHNQTMTLTHVTERKDAAHAPHAGAAAA